MKKIELTQGKFTLVDNKDFELLKQYSCFYNQGYAWVRINGKQILMHRFIMGNPSFDIDHLNGDKLDNRRKNLRVCNASQNAANAKKRKGCSSKYKGVSWDKVKKNWMVYANGIYIGRFSNELQAAKTYDLKAKELFGEFAKVNF
jgi:hypothetical protein